MIRLSNFSHQLMSLIAIHHFNSIWKGFFTLCNCPVNKMKSNVTRYTNESNMVTKLSLNFFCTVEDVKKYLGQFEYIWLFVAVCKHRKPLKKNYFYKAELNSTQLKNKKMRPGVWGLNSHVSYLLEYNDTHSVFMPLTDLMARYSNWVVTTFVTHSTGDCTNMFRMKLVCERSQYVVPEAVKRGQWTPCWL